MFLAFCSLYAIILVQLLPFWLTRYYIIRRRQTPASVAVNGATQNNREIVTYISGFAEGRSRDLGGLQECVAAG